MVWVLDSADIGRLVSMAEAIAAVREAVRGAAEHGAGRDVPLGAW